MNATEDLRTLSFENIVPYLLEEYTIDEINVFNEYIRDQIVEINAEKSFEREVIGYCMENGLDVVNDKRGTMRFYSNVYGKHGTVRVFNVLRKYFGL